MKNKDFFGIVVIVVFLGIMGYFLTQSTIAYENDFDVIKTVTKTVKATGRWVKEKGCNIDVEKNIAVFYIADNHNVELKVVYKGILPNNFETSQNLVVKGKYTDGIFLATNILTKCPSKYQQTYRKELEKNKVT